MGDFIGFDYQIIFEFAKIYGYTMDERSLQKLRICENFLFDEIKRTEKK